MAIGAIGFFGRGDLMRQRLHWNAQRNPPMPMSTFAQKSVVDVGLMPGSVEAPVPGENAAVPAVSGWGGYSGWGRVTSGQVLSAVAAAPLGPAGIAIALNKNNKSIAHAKKQVVHFAKLYAKVKSKGKKDKRVAVVKAKLDHWKRVLAQLTRRKAALQKAKAHKKWEKGFTKRAKKAARKGQVIPFTPAQRRRQAAAAAAALAASQVIATRTLNPSGVTYALPTASQAASMASLATASSQGAMVPPGSYDYMAATSLPTTATSSAYAPSTIMRAQDVDINDDGIRDDINADGSTRLMGDQVSADADGAVMADEDEGIMARIGGFFADIPTWAKIGGGVVIVGAIFSRTKQGKAFIAKLKRKGGGGGGE